MNDDMLAHHYQTKQHAVPKTALVKPHVTFTCLHVLYMCYLSGIYRVSQEAMSIFWEVTVSVILSKKVYICPILNGV